MGTRRDEKAVYALKLEGENAYVGVAVNPEDRISRHVFNNGHHWTTRHRPRRVLNIYLPTEEYLQLENDVAVWLAGLIGTEKVAGGRYTGRSKHHHFPPSVQNIDSPGWEVIGENHGVAIAEYLDLDAEVAADLDIPQV